MAVITMRVTDQEKAMLQRMAEFNNSSTSSMIKKIVFDHFEDEYDIKAADQAYKEYLEDPQTYTQDEVKAMLGL